MKTPLTTQELLERYIWSVRTMLLPDKAGDIAAEIRSHLQSQMEERSEELGRELSVPELSAMLRQHGHPVVVAGRYRDVPARALIGPAVFPLYWLALRSLLGLIFTILVVKAAYVFPGRLDLSSFLFEFGRESISAAIVVTGGVTLVFAVWEYLEFKNRYSERWKPERLAAVPPTPRRAPQQRPATAVIGGGVWLVFFATALFLPQMWWVWGGMSHYGVSETTWAMRLPVWLFAVFALSQTWLRYTRFAAADWRPYLRIAADVAGIVLAVVLFRSGDLLAPGANWDPARYGASLVTLNRIVSGSLVLVCILLSLGIVQELRCLLRHTGHRTAHSTT